VLWVDKTTGCVSDEVEVCIYAWLIHQKGIKIRKE